MRLPSPSRPRTRRTSTTYCAEPFRTKRSGVWIPIGGSYSTTQPKSASVFANNSVPRESLDAPRERNRITCLHDKVQVVRLDGEMDDPEAIAFATQADARCDHAEAGPRPKSRCLGANARGHVDRVPCRERRPADVRHTSSGFLRTPCPRPVPAASAIPQIEPELFRLPSHH